VLKHRDTLFTKRFKLLYLNIFNLDLPFPTDVRDTENNAVSLSWLNNYPDKELEIWIFDQEDFYVEALLGIKDKDEELTLTSIKDVTTLIIHYTNTNNDTTN
jgi:hypothetical protein